MIISAASQASLFISSLIIGFFLGFVFDWFRVFRKVVKHPGFLIQLEDLLYWLFVSILMFYFFMSRNDGEIRIFSIIGMFLGMLLYFQSLSPLFLKVSLTILSVIWRMINIAFGLILAPLTLAVTLAGYPLGVLRSLLLKVIHIIGNNSRKAARYGSTTTKKGIDTIKKRREKMKKESERNRYIKARRKKEKVKQPESAPEKRVVNVHIIKRD